MSKLRELRMQQGKPARDVAYDLDVSQQTIFNWENDSTTPNPENAARLAEYYDVTIPELELRPARYPGRPRYFKAGHLAPELVKE